jgi:hypothetical protein
MAINSVEMMERLEPMMLEDHIHLMLKRKDEVGVEYALKKISKLNILKSAEIIKSLDGDYSHEVKNLIHDTRVQLVENAKLGDTVNQIAELAESRLPSERILALRLIDLHRKEEYYHYLHVLLRDMHPFVRINAIVTAAQIGKREFWHPIIDNLSVPAYTNTAMVALVHIGTPVLDELDHLFNKSGQKMKILARIIRIYGRVGGMKATELLWKKAEFPEPKIIAQVFHALSQSGYQATPNYRARIKNEIEEDISKTAWNIAALEELSTSSLGKMVRSAIEEENEEIYKHIYMLLAMIYEDLSVKLVRENIETGNSEDLTYAIELLDVFLDDELKPKLIPLIDDLPINEKLRRLQLQFPREAYDDYEVLNQIINRDYNKINRWTKACAIYHLGHHKKAAVTDILIANIFNPDTLMRETAAWAIFQMDQEQYHINTQRLDPSIKRSLDDMISRHSAMDRYALLFHRIMFLKGMKLFAGVPSSVLAGLGELLEEEIFDGGEVIVREGRYHISPFYVIESGKVKISDGLDQEILLGSGQFFGMSFLTDPNDETFGVEALDPVRVFRIDREEFYRFTSRNYQVIERILLIERKMGKASAMV